MSIAVLAIVAWVVLIVFALVPKGLTLTDIVFLYFITVIVTITVFAILDTNLQWVPVTRSVEGSFAMYICRYIVIPFHILLSVSILLSHSKAKRRWGLAAAIVASLCLADRIYLWTDLMTYKRWNEFYSALMYGVFIVIMYFIARWFLGLEKGESNNT